MTDLSDLLGDDPPGELPATVKADTLAALLGINRQRLNELAGSGKVIRTDRGRYDLGESVRRYCSGLRSHAAKAGRPTTDEAKAERARLTKLQADGQEIKNRQMTGDLIPLADIRLEWATLAVDLRSALLAVPGRLGLDRAITDKVDAEIRRALEGMSNNER